MAKSTHLLLSIQFTAEQDSPRFTIYCFFSDYKYKGTWAQKLKEQKLKETDSWQAQMEEKQLHMQPMPAQAQGKKDFFFAGQSERKGLVQD